MVTILSRLSVQSFEPWLGMFRKHAPTRAEFGCRKETVYRPPGNGGEVFLLLEWTSEKAFHEYLGWLRPQDRAAEAGVVVLPEHTVLGEPAA